MDRVYAKMLKKKGKMPMPDKWSGLADLLSNLIEKYISDLDIEDIKGMAVKIGTENKTDKIEE